MAAAQSVAALLSSLLSGSVSGSASLMRAKPVELSWLAL
jgi:hypothetical protein